MRLEYRFAAQRHRERHRAAGEAFRQADDIGDHPRLVAGEARAGAAPAGHHLVGDEEDAVRRTNAAHFGEHPRRIDQHAAGAEDQRFDDEGGGFLQASGFECVERGLFHAVMGEGDGVDVEQQRLPRAVVDAALADRHRADGVAMIAVVEDENAAARLAYVEPVAERHLERDLDAGRARVRKEDAGERGGGDADQFGGEAFGGLVRPAREDELVELFGLGPDRSHDLRVRMAVRRHPPARDRVDPAVAVAVIEARALGAVDQRNRLAEAVLGEGVPDGGSMVEVHGAALQYIVIPAKAGISSVRHNSKSGSRPSPG